MLHSNYMALVDELTLKLKAGKGGNGVVRWIHEKFKEYGGPGGGNGGRGGSVFARGVKDSWLLARYRHVTELSAGNGVDGGNHHMKGGDGEDMVIDFPVGSIITNQTTGEVFELDEVDQTIELLKGGNGGLGNDHFKGSTNQQPKESTPGKPGEEGIFFIEVQLIADAGFIGLPNAGKSSLLNSLTRADVKVGNYQFTTLEPNLGDLYGHILADIPGLIEGASEGKGLGHKFLRHIKRTKLLVHCITCEHYLDGGIDEIAKIYQTIRTELTNFDEELAAKEEIILLTKTDTIDKEQLLNLKNELAAHPLFAEKFKQGAVYFITILDDNDTKQFSQNLIKVLEK